MRRAIFAAMLLLSSANAGADTCVTFDLGHESTYLSENRTWRLVLRAPDRVSLHRKGAWRAHARWTLVYSPAGLTVANDGSVITFGAGCSMGRGKSAVVIYRPDGSLVRQLALSDFLQEEDIAAIPRTVSSIQWSGEHRIDVERRQLILQVKGPPRPVELPISLDTGELLVPKVRRFHVPRFSPEVSYGVADGVAAKCDGVAIGSAELLSLALEPVNAVYPPVAIKARISGQVVVELAVNEDGIVDGVTVIKPLPFGLDQSAATAARQWKFRASKGRVCGRIAFSFGMTEG
jgi:TonB family protein